MTVPPIPTPAIADRWLTLHKMAAALARFPASHARGGPSANHAALLPCSREGCTPAALHRACTGDRKWLDWLARVDEWTWRRFPGPQFGAWFGCLDRAGEPALTLKGVHYKGGFHIPTTLLLWGRLSRLRTGFPAGSFWSGFVSGLR
ncbi:MAG: hypothetical protein ABSC08_05885 [Bryobacteraceae bacterium]